MNFVIKMKYNLLSLAFIVDSVSCKIIDYRAESPTFSFVNVFDEKLGCIYQVRTRAML